MANAKPAPDDEPAIDPFEAELVAFLDGELDPDAARKVEARLARDPAARARAAELKKSFDMLDYLPKPEPSATFTTRTLDKLPTVKPANNPDPPRPVRGAAGLSTSLPVALELDEEPPPRRLLRFARIGAFLSLSAVLGYFATALVRPHLVAGGEKASVEARDEVEPRVIENLPLYAGADDLAFVAELTKAEYFGEHPAVAFEPGPKHPPGEAREKPGTAHFDTLLKAFHALPAPRRAQILKLDQELYALEPHTRDRYVRVLEAYAVWLERLPEADRARVLTAPVVGRLGVVSAIRKQQALDALPESVRSKETVLNRWREDESLRRERLAFVRRHADVFAAGKSLWPFDTEAGRKEVDAFVRDVFKVDDPKKCRLSNDELAEYKRVHKTAQDDNAWAWYGLYVYELAMKYPYLPEPADPKLMYTDMGELPGKASEMLQMGKKAGLPGVVFVPQPLRPKIGKWPEFPLEAHRELSRFKLGFSSLPQLGPAELKDFKPAVRTFAEEKLFPKMSDTEKKELNRSSGRWPDYPQRFKEYALKYDLSVPGVTLPLFPKRWDATYGKPPPAKQP
jgi:hypothetical protein